ncbi:MAG: hypothetical protein HYX32_03325 [Actinobacteria bacterium]|nr:hypothetical protein [Actinomycetota bacterium]
MAAAPPADRDLLELAVDLARGAGELTLQWFRSPTLEIERKGDGTPVTEADKRAERFLREQIAKHHPDDAVIGEEEDDVGGTSGRTWIIDPIDGTKPFTHGVPLYCNLVAVNDVHGPAVGVINLPALGETVYAGRGLGCFANGEPVRVNNRADLPGACLVSSAFDYWPTNMLLAVKEAGLAMRTWGDGYGYVLVATGRAEAMVDPEAAIWDLAPMPVIFREAGGRFTDFGGMEDPSSGTGVATNGVLHDEMLRLLRR